MNSDSTHAKEEVERLPADDSDLENGERDGHRNDSGRSQCAGGTIKPSDREAANLSNGTGQSSATSGDPEKRGDVEIVDWDGPNDPENP